MPKREIRVAGELLTIGNYKEPLKPIEDGAGFGFYGTLLMSTDGSMVQCHYCGKMFGFLPNHLKKAHLTNTIEYRARFNIAKATALCSDERREQMKNSLGAWMAKLTPAQKAAWYKKSSDALQAWRDRGNSVKGWRKSLETANKRGNCPDQVLEHIRKLSVKIGRTPTYKELGQRYGQLCYKIYGSYNKALEQLNLETRERGINLLTRNKQTNEELILAMQSYYKATGKSPTHSDFTNIPSESGRAYLPSYDAYRRRFGSIGEARKAAGVPEPTYSTGRPWGEGEKGVLDRA